VDLVQCPRTVISADDSLDREELLSELAQIVQHLGCQFTTSVGSDVQLDNCEEQLVDLL
jgi:hypothetical protein